MVKFVDRSLVTAGFTALNSSVEHMSRAWIVTVSTLYYAGDLDALYYCGAWCCTKLSWILPLSTYWPTRIMAYIFALGHYLARDFTRTESYIHARGIRVPAEILNRTKLFCSSEWPKPEVRVKLVDQIRLRESGTNLGSCPPGAYSWSGFSAPLRRLIGFAFFLFFLCNIRENYFEHIKIY
jgi:hypothetical protein